MHLFSAVVSQLRNTGHCNTSNITNWTAVVPDISLTVPLTCSSLRPQQ